MINLLSSFVLLLFVLGFTLIEKKYYHNLFSPFIVTAWPFVVISLLVNLLAVHFDFLPVTARANYFILLNLFIIWVIGYFFYRLKNPNLSIKNYADIFSRYKDFRYFLLLLAWIVIVTNAIKVLSILGREGFLYAGLGEFEDIMSRGITAHLIQFGQVVFILFVLSFWKSKMNLIDYLTIILLGLTIASVMIKYPIVWTVMIILFIKGLNMPVKMQLKKVTNISFFIVALFSLNFLVLYSRSSNFSITNKVIWGGIFGWLVNYLLSGPILLDQWLKWAFTKPWWSLFIVPINFFYVITGNPTRLKAVDFVSPGFIHILPDKLSNVGTSFGVYYIIGGIALTLISTIVIASLSYYFFILSMKSPNPIIIFITSIFLIMGTLSFFVQYFTLLSTYEMTFFYILLVGIFEIVIKIKNAKPIKI